MGNCPHSLFCRLCLLEVCCKGFGELDDYPFFVCQKSKLTRKKWESLFTSFLFFCMETEKTLLTRLAWMTILILLVGWCILREIAFSRQVLERRPHTMTNPPRTNLTYQYILCTQNSPCSPMAEYYVSPLCYGYLDSHSGTGSP